MLIQTRHRALLSLLTLTVLTNASPTPQEHPLGELLAGLPPNHLHDALHDGLAGKFSHGVFLDDRTAVEAVHVSDAEAATRLVELARRQARQNVTSTATTLPPVLPPTTTTRISTSTTPTSVSTTSSVTAPPSSRSPTSAKPNSVSSPTNTSSSFYSPTSSSSIAIIPTSGSSSSAEISSSSSPSSSSSSSSSAPSSTSSTTDSSSSTTTSPSSSSLSTQTFLSTSTLPDGSRSTVTAITVVGAPGATNVVGPTPTTSGASTGSSPGLQSGIATSNGIGRAGWLVGLLAIGAAVV